MAMTYYKILTHEWRSPLQGGDPLCDGRTWPVDLPSVPLDTSSAECAPGWNCVHDLAAGFRIAGLWTTGRPSQVVIVEPGADAITRAEKTRSSRLRLVRLATEAEIHAGIVALSAPFAPHVDAMVDAQLAWRAALARPAYDAARVEAGLLAALAARGLASWTLRAYPTVRAAMAARAARVAWDAWDARDAMAARAARAVWDVWAARAARAAWDVWAAWAAWDVWAARAARAALSHRYAVLAGWITGDPNQYDVGIHDAYGAGLALAAPVARGVLGYVMQPVGV